MNKIYIAALSFLIFSFVGAWAVSAQTDTSTPSPTITPTPTMTRTPSGAPKTGFGTVR